MTSYIPAKKSLGQNFLVDGNMRRKIIAACNVKKTDTVVEIGPGKGALTQDLAHFAKKVIAVEKDTRLFEYLKLAFNDVSNLILVNQDMLKFNITEKRTKVIGNIPYNITSPLIEHLINQKEKISEIFLCVQKELAVRMVATPGSKDYSAFSLFVQYFTLPDLLFSIKNSCFRPQPKVDSCFMNLKVRKKPSVTVLNEILLFVFIRESFNRRRKMILNTLKEFLDKKGLAELARTTNIDTTIRPDRLSINDFARIANFIFKYEQG
ncbi:16S rRNA (adenine(1518)-N(6)/adenine(1519)-N(6))-dimethyltransferase RsmA [Candidatus Omnitrophota bacterium]